MFIFLATEEYMSSTESEPESIEKPYEINKQQEAGPSKPKRARRGNIYL